MSVVCAAQGYLTVADDCDTSDRDYMIHAWVWASSLVALTVVSSGSDASADEDYRGLHLADTGAIQARENEAGSTSTATSQVASGETYQVEGWVPGSATFFTATLRYACADGIATRINSTSREPATPFTYLKIGARANQNGGNANIRIAGVTIWDVTGYSAADILALNVRLGRSTDILVDDPRTIDEEAGQLWTGNLLHFWRLSDVDDLTDLKGSDDLTVVSAGGYPITGVDGSATPINPPYAAYAIPTVTAVSSDPLIEGNAASTITGTNHEVNGDDPSALTIGGESQTIGSATATVTTFTPSVGDLLYGRSYDVVLTGGSGEVSDSEFEVSIAPAATEAYTDITEAPATAGLRITSTPDIAIGSQVHYRNFLNASAAAQDIADVTVQADGSITINDDTITRPATLEVRVNNNDGEGWSAFETITLDDPAAPVNPELIGVDEIDAAYFLGESFSITLGQQLSGGTWPWTLEAGGPWPGDFALNAGTGEITGTATPVGAYGPFTVRATGDTVDVDFTVTVTVSALPVSPLNTRTPGTIARFGALMSR